MPICWAVFVSRGWESKCDCRNAYPFIWKSLTTATFVLGVLEIFKFPDHIEWKKVMTVKLDWKFSSLFHCDWKSRTNFTKTFQRVVNKWKSKKIEIEVVYEFLWGLKCGGILLYLSAHYLQQSEKQMLKYTTLPDTVTRLSILILQIFLFQLKFLDFCISLAPNPK